MNEEQNWHVLFADDDPALQFPEDRKNDDEKENDK